MRRSLHDPVWADQVILRWQRRRWKVQQRDKAVADLKAAMAEALEPVMLRLVALVNRLPARFR